LTGGGPTDRGFVRSRKVGWISRRHRRVGGWMRRGYMHQLGSLGSAVSVPSGAGA
jgi:hypothetical protein